MKAIAHAVRWCVLTVMACGMFATMGNARVGELEADLLGTWRCTSAEAKEAGDGTEEKDTWTFEKERVIVSSPRGREEFRYRIDSSASPPRIDWEATDELGNTWVARGIVKCDGRNLQICARVALTGEKVVRPSQFKTDKDDHYLRMILFTRVEADGAR